MTATQVELKTETQDFIAELVENSYCEEDIYDFIEEKGEDNLVNYYEDYCELGEEYSYDAVDAFVAEFGIQSIAGFEDAYRGEYSSKADYAELYVTDCYTTDLPGFVEVDWEATFDNMDFVFTDNGFVFDTQF